MGKNKAEQEELKKLEDEAYFELCQIIAEAVQIQDIDLLDQRIDYWKKKYKKLLDSSNGSASSNFKKRIEFLLNQYYSEITQYILKQIRLKEEKKIENQSKALRKLYRIIKDTNDLKLLKNKVKEWEEEYPISSFLKMYQKRIKMYTNDKNLESNAFDQDTAFHDLYYITKLNRTFDEFKSELSNWEDKYSIHDKFELDDFIKHQTEIRRYFSDEYLKSIAKVEEQSENINYKEKTVIPVQEIENEANTSKKDYSSNLSKQAVAYSALMSIARKPNNTDEMFKWVYKNSSIGFNDKYKELILNAIYLDYSPSYLSSLSTPKIKFSGSMSLEEYQNIDEIKRYAVISYFNLLLPPEKAIPNNFFNQYIETIYHKSASKPKNLNNNQIDNILQSGIEISLSPEPDIDVKKDIGEKFIEEDTPSLEINMTQIGDDVASKTITDSIAKKVDSSYEKTLEEPSFDELPKTSSLEKNGETEVSTTKVEKSDDTISRESSNIQGQNTTVSSGQLYDLEDETRAKKEKGPDIREKEELELSKSKSSREETISPEMTKEVLEEESATSLSETDKKSSQVEIVIQSEPEVVETVSTPIIKANSHKENKPNIETSDSVVLSKGETSEPITYDTVVALSPQFFNMINFYNSQAVLIEKIDNNTNRYMSLEDRQVSTIVKSRDNNIN